MDRGPESALAGGLGLVHERIPRPEHGVDRRRRFQERHGAHSDLDVLLSLLRGGRQRLLQAGGDLPHRGRVRAGKDDGELVAADARRSVGLPHLDFEHAADIAEQGVPRTVAPSVVDAFEVVAIEVEEGNGAARPAGPLQFVVGRLQEGPAVGQAGEHVLAAEDPLATIGELQPVEDGDDDEEIGQAEDGVPEMRQGSA